MLWDLARARIHWPSTETKALVQLAMKTRPAARGRVAVVVGEDLAFGLARMYGSFADELPAELQRRESRLQKIREARKRLEARKAAEAKEAEAENEPLPKDRKKKDRKKKVVETFLLRIERKIIV